jgi:hypothetical protein
MYILITMEINHFTAKKWRTGTSWVITVPTAWASLMDKDKEYKITITEVEDNG